MRESKNYASFKADTDLSQFDHVIIGSGIGALTTATWLIKAGLKVAILERHFKPGGFMHSFKRKNGYYWDVGVHYVGNVKKGEGIRRFFNLLTNNKLDWAPMGEVYDEIQIGGDKYQFVAGKEAQIKQLKNYFPENKEDIDKYFAAIDKVNSSAMLFFAQKVFKPFLSATLGSLFRKGFFKNSDKTTLEVLQSITTNKRLIAVLCGQCGNYGLAPAHSSFAAHAIVVSHFIEGGFYPIGGAEKIWEHAVEQISTLGSKVFVNCDVQAIEVKKNKVQGLTIDGKFYPCKSVISNAGTNNTFKNLLNQESRERCGYELNNVPPSNSHMCLYVGLDKSDEELQLPKNNVWHFAHNDLDQIIDQTTLETAGTDFSYISFPSAKDPQWTIDHPGKSTIQALSIGDINWFKPSQGTKWKKRADGYEEKKKLFENNMLKTLYNIFPQIKGHVAITEVSTPLSTQHFMNCETGEIYGLSHSPNRFRLNFLRPETRIKGLRLVGQDITLVGVAGAMFSGVLCAITILKWRVWRIFKDFGQYG